MKKIGIVSKIIVIVLRESFIEIRVLKAIVIIIRIIRVVTPSIIWVILAPLIALGLYNFRLMSISKTDISAGFRSDRIGPNKIL